MKMQYYFYILILVHILLCSCNRGEEFEYAIESKIVVEGWIEEGEVAKVILTRSVPVQIVLDSANYRKYIINTAIVIVSDGQQDDTLSLRIREEHLPPFVYEGRKIIGKEGTKYTLKVIHLSKTITSETCIPPSVPIEEVNYHKTQLGDTVGNLSIRFTNPENQTNYYQISTLLVDYDEIFVPAFYGNLDSRYFGSSTIDFNIIRGLTIFPKTNLHPHFNDGDVVVVKLRTMNRECFDFWNSWQNELMNTQNPIFPANTSLKSNIVGGIGIWGGYGKSIKQITAE